jgi:hypothetical protein
MSDTPPPPDAERSLGRGPLTPGPDDAVRPVLRTLVEMHDALRLATRELAAARDATAPVSPLAPPIWWRRLLPFRRRAHAELEILAAARARLVAALTGLEMTARRVERALERHDLEPIAAEGRPFDPETMEVLEVVAADGRTSGEVFEEVRRGYRWRGRVFRCAQVRVAK